MPYALRHKKTQEILCYYVENHGAHESFVEGEDGRVWADNELEYVRRVLNGELVDAPRFDRYNVNREDYEIVQLGVVAVV